MNTVAKLLGFAAYGRAMTGMRDKVHFQFHFGANYETGTYSWTTDFGYY